MTDPPPPTGPPPGWYTDPTTGHGLRWWDGAQWTDATMAGSTTPTLPGSALEPVGQWMGRTFRLAGSRAGHFLPMIVLLMVPTVMANGLAVWSGLRQAVLVTDADSGEFSFTNPGGGAGPYGLILMTFVLVITASVVVSVAAVRQALTALDERPEPWSDSMRAAFGRAGRAIGVAVALTGLVFGSYLVMGLMVAISPLLILIALPAWVAGVAWAGVRLSLAPTAAALAPAAARALATSWSLTRSHFWPLLGRFVVLVFVAISISLLASVVSAPFTALAGGGSSGQLDPSASELRFADFLGDNPAVFAIGQLFSARGNGATTVLWSVGLGLVYRDLDGPAEEWPEEGAQP